jgi:hypothetical protein
MSELTECNWCAYQEILRQAREGGHTVTVTQRDGMVVVLFDDDPEPVAGFMVLPQRCACD